MAGTKTPKKAATKRFQKFMLHQGTYFDAAGKRVDYDPERIRSQHETFKKMTAAGYDVSVHFDHSNDPTKVVPIKRGTNARSARDTAGKLVEFTPNADGTNAKVVVELSDPKAIQLADSDHVQLSPIILPEWTDGKGTQYKDIITTMDLVNLPADNSQTPFEPVPGMIACSLRMSLDGGTRISQPFLLAKDPFDDDDDEDLDDLDDDDDDDQLGDDDDDLDAIGGLDDGADAGAGDELAGDLGSDDLGDDLLDDTSELDNDLGDDLGGGAGDIDSKAEEDALVEQIKQDFAAIGVVAPDIDIREDPIQWLSVMASILRQKALTDKEPEMVDDDPLNNDQLPAAEEPITVTAPNFATMGLDPKAAKAATDNWKKMQADIEQANRRANASASALIAMSRQQQGDKLTGLLDTGRCTPAEYKQWSQALVAIKMSLTDDGHARPTKVDMFIKHRESIPEGTFFDQAARLSRASIAPHPATVEGDVTPEKAKAYNDELAKANPGAMRRPAAATT